MGNKTTSTTRQRESTNLGGTKDWDTRISDGHTSVTGAGATAEKSQEAASKKWDKKQH